MSLVILCTTKQFRYPKENTIFRDIKFQIYDLILNLWSLTKMQTEVLWGDCGYQMYSIHQTYKKLYLLISLSRRIASNFGLTRKGSSSSIKQTFHNDSQLILWKTSLLEDRYYTIRCSHSSRRNHASHSYPFCF